jgi:hypothetical protein
MRPVDFGAKAGVAFFAALLAMSGQATAQATTGALPTTPPNPQGLTAPIEQRGDAVDQAEPRGAEGSGMILVSKRPIEMLAGPSSSASALYGFPAGRPFRVIGRNAGFAQIQDVKSGASGWIDEAALSPSPVPTTSGPSEPKPAISNQRATTASPDPKPKATKEDTQDTVETGTATAERDPVQTPKRSGFLGLGGNGDGGGLAGFLGGVFGAR